MESDEEGASGSLDEGSNSAVTGGMFLGPKLDVEKDKREIGDLGIWTLSSSKSGFGVDQLRDDSVETFWQSDGPQPHLVNIQFPRKTLVKDVAIYLDFKQDESYTPSKIAISAGTCFHDLQVSARAVLLRHCSWSHSMVRKCTS